MMYKKRSGRRCQSRQFPKSLLPDTLLMLWNHLSRPFSAKFVVFLKRYRVTLKLHKRFRSQPITLGGIYFALNSGTGISTSTKEKKLEDSGISETEFCIFLCSRSLLNIWKFFSWFDEFHFTFFLSLLFVIFEQKMKFIRCSMKETHFCNFLPFFLSFFAFDFHLPQGTSINHIQYTLVYFTKKSIRFELRSILKKSSKCWNITIYKP